MDGVDFVDFGGLCSSCGLAAGCFGVLLLRVAAASGISV